MSSSVDAAPTVAASPRPAASIRTPLKRFSHAQIAEKVRERSGVAEYEALLMSAAVQQDDGGVVFDSTAAGWKELVRRCEQADKAARDSERRRKERSTQQAGVVARSSSPSTANPSSTTSLLSKLTAAISPATNRAESAEEDAAVSGSAVKSSSVRGRPVIPHHPPGAGRVRRGSQPTAAPNAGQPSSHIAQPTATSDSDTQSERRMKRPATVTPPSPVPNVVDEAHTVAAGAGDADSVAATSSPSHSDSRRIRPVRMLHSAAHRTNADRIKRSANKQVRDAQQLQADLAFEQRLSDEVDGRHSDEQVSAEWRERRQRENEREAERRRREEEEERQRIAAGGRKKRKLVIPSAGLIHHPDSGESIDELDYMTVLLQQLSQPDDRLVDWRLTAQLAGVTGLPHRHRMRVWGVMLKQSAAASEPQQQEQSAKREDTEDEELEAAISALTLSADWSNEAAVPSLETDTAPLPSSSLPSPRLDLINQRTVRVDIDRTLPHFSRMQRQDVKHDMEVILTAYQHTLPQLTLVATTCLPAHRQHTSVNQASRSTQRALSAAVPLGAVCSVTASVITSRTSRA